MDKRSSEAGADKHAEHLDHGHGIMDKIHVILGTNLDDELLGTDGGDLILGRKGGDKIDGGAGNDLLFGGKGNDLLFGGADDDFVFGDKGDDQLDGGAGSDKLFGGKGDDLANYALSPNVGAHDFYDGGKGSDTLQLTLTGAEFDQQSVQKDIADFKAFLADNENGHGGHGKTFHFQSFDLDVRNFEDLEINMAPVARDVHIGGSGGGAGPIHVLVVGGNTSSSYLDAAGQLTDTTVFDFDVTAILDDSDIDWATKLENINVVVLGDTGAGVDYGNTPLFPALVGFVNDGGGVITTGGFANILSNTAGTLTPAILHDADTISPVTTDGFLFADEGTITILDPSHPIANGLGSYEVMADQSELAEAIDGGATILANTTGAPNEAPAAIAYAEVGDGRTAYLGSLYMANEDFFPNAGSLRFPGSDADKIFEQAVAWAAGDRSGGGGAATDEDTPLTIDAALLRAASTDADGDAVAIFSVSPMSALGAAISFDEHGDIVYNPTSSPALQGLSTGESAADSFDYTISDGHGGFDTASVSLTVAGITDAVI